MKKIFLLFAMWAFAHMTTFGQNWVEANPFGSKGDESGGKVVIDDQGNRYMAGACKTQGTLNFGNGVIIPDGVTGVYLVKFHPNGMAQWVRTFQGFSVKLADLKINRFSSSPEIAILLNHMGMAVQTPAKMHKFYPFDGPYPGTNAFIKFDQLGEVIMSKNYGPAARNQYTLELVVTTTISTFDMTPMTTYFAGQMGVLGAVVEGHGAILENISFLAQIHHTNTYDIFLWMKEIAGDPSIYQPITITSVSTGPSGNCYLTGHFTGTAMFLDALSLQGLVKGSPNTQTGFVASVPISGSITNSSVIGINVEGGSNVSGGQVEPTSIIADMITEDVYIGGTFMGGQDDPNIDTHSTEILGNVIVAPEDEKVAFVAKVYGSGTPWVAQTLNQSSNTREAEAVRLGLSENNKSGDPLMIASFSQDLLELQGTTLTHTGPGAYDSFVASLYEGDGSLNWILQGSNNDGGGYFNTRLNAVYGGLNKDVFVAGEFHSLTNFGFQINPIGGSDIVLARIGVDEIRRSSDQKMSLSVYPNPVGDFLNIVFTPSGGSASIAIHDDQGNLVIEIPFTNLVDTRSLRGGGSLYHFSVYNNGQIQTVQFIKK